MTYWKDCARNCLDRIARNAIAKYGKPAEWDQLTKLAVKRTIDEAYPFGVRANHPYKIWLEERKETLIELGIEKRRIGAQPKGGRQPKPKQDEVAPGQLSLF